MLKRMVLIAGALAMLAMVVIAVWFLFGDIVRERVRRVEFNHVVWQAGGHGTNDVRIRMVDNLLHRHNFRGATRQELTGLLGEPDNTSYFKDWDMVYWLGPNAAFSVSIPSGWFFGSTPRKR